MTQNEFCQLSCAQLYFIRIFLRLPLSVWFYSFSADLRLLITFFGLILTCNLTKNYLMNLSILSNVLIIPIWHWLEYLLIVCVDILFIAPPPFSMHIIVQLNERETHNWSIKCLLVQYVLNHNYFQWLHIILSLQQFTFYWLRPEHSSHSLNTFIVQ